jgi:hypothetical protein
VAGVSLKQVLIAIDQLAHTLIGGMADETLSAAAWRWERAGQRAWPRRAIDVLFFWQPGHCESSWRAELLRTQLPKGYRN